MTEPGHIAPASPGWWVRTNRVGINASSYHWTTTIAGNRASQGAGTSAYGWAGAATGKKTIQVIGSAAAGTNNVAIPTHAVGDLIVIGAYDALITTGPNPPAAGGTVPAWVVIDGANGANGNAMATYQFVATATTTTTGTWSNAGGIIAVVIRNQNVSPIGGHAESGSTSGTVSVAPAITMIQTDGSSLILEFHGHKTASAWGTAPSGYTRLAAVTGAAICLNTKDVRTSDGSVSQTLTGTNVGYRGATVEILN